jgi:large subunit ribosomal protein L24
MSKFKRSDEIIVIAGRDKGKSGKVTRILKDDQLIVSGINMVKRHTKGNPQRGSAGGIVEKEAPIHVSNVAILNAATNKADRIGYSILEDGSKVRIYKSNQEVIDA